MFLDHITTAMKSPFCNSIQLLGSKVNIYFINDEDFKTKNSIVEI